MRRALCSTLLLATLASCSADSSYSSPYTPGTNVSLGGESDFGYFRKVLASGQVPRGGDLDAPGFFAEHHTALPPATCGDRICLHAMLGAMGRLAGGERTTILQLGMSSPLSADPARRPPLDLALVVDTSGSMAAGGKMDFVKQGLRELIGALRDGDRVAMITYATDVVRAAPMRDVGPARAELRERIEALHANGGTNLWGGLEAGYQEIAGAPADATRQRRVVLLSDGQPTAGVTDSATIVANSRAYNGEGIGLTTIGLGTDFNHELMRDLALQGDGNFYFVEDATAVSEVFVEEASYFTVPVAKDVHLSIRAGADFTFRSAYGSSRFVSSADGGTLDVPSVFLAHRTSAGDVRDPGAERRGGGSALLIELGARPDDGTAPSSARVAEVTWSYLDPSTGGTVTSEVTVHYPFAPWVTPPKGHFSNPTIEKSFVMLELYRAITESADLFHAGKGTEALTLLTRVTAAARDYEDSANDGTGDLDIRLDVELLDQLARTMRAHGAVPPTNLTLPTDPWPAD